MHDILWIAMESSRAVVIRAMGLTALAAMAAAPARAQTLKTVRVGASLDDGITPLLYGMQSGIFAKAGLDVQLVSSASGAALAGAVAGDTIDIAKSSLMALITAYSRGIPFKIVAGSATYSSGSATTQLCVLRDSPITTFAQTRGKTVATTALQSLDMIGAESLIDQRGGDSTTMKFLEMPTSTMLAALESGRVDIAAIINPTLADALATGKIRAFAPPYEGIGKHFLIAAWFSTAAFAARNAETVAAFARAMRAATTYTNAHHAETVPILATYAKLDPDVISRMNRLTNATEVRPGDIQPAINAAVKYRVIDKAFSAGELLIPGL